MCRRRNKKLLAKTPLYKAFQQALRNYRNCPRYDGLSQAQWNFGRPQRTEAIAFRSAYECIPDRIVAKHELQRQRKTDKVRTHANKHVLTKRWDQREEIVENRDNGRSYLVQMNGRRFLRNRRFLRPLPKQQQHAKHKQQCMATNIQPPGDHNMRARNQPPYHIPTLIRTQTQAPRPDSIPERPWPRKQDTTPTRIYSQHIRRQRTYY